MKIDKQLIFEAETLIPKVNRDNCHILQNYLMWYQRPYSDEEHKLIELWLRKAVNKARILVAENNIKDCCVE